MSNSTLARNQTDQFVRLVKIGVDTRENSYFARLNRICFDGDRLIPDIPVFSGVEDNDLTVTFFSPKVRFLANENRIEEYRRRNLAPVHPYLLSVVNLNDRAFADSYPNCTYLMAEDGESLIDIHFGSFFLQSN